MKELKVKDEMSILEAIDFLSSLSEIDVTISSRALGEKERDTLHPHRWLDQKLIAKNQEIITYAFRSILHYIQDIHEKHPEQLKDEQILKGLQSILSILDEAVEKIEKFTDLFKESPALDSLMELDDYRKLQEYLTSNILPYFSEEEDYWQEDLGVQEEDLVGVAKKGLRDIEDTKEDKLYDLFYIKKENHKPFYDYDMVRRLKLLYDFDQLIEQDQEENSFIRIRQLQDKDFYQKAASILNASSYLVGSFYKDGMKLKGVPFVAAMNKTLMSLMLAANPRNWQNSSSSQDGCIFKSSAEYFGDFHCYLREALTSPEYKKMLKTRSDSTNPLYQTCFLLVHKLCAAYFLTVSLQKETVSFIRRMIHTGSKMTQVQEPTGKHPSLWKELLWEDDSIRQVLQKQPSGPIRRIIESFLKGEIGKGWDPLSSKNIPTHLFTLEGNRKEVAFLRMPAPLMQKSIQNADVSVEFENFLKGCLLGDKHQKFLLVNLQDRTTWEEHARSEALEDFSKKEDLVRVFSLIGLPKKTDFYFQKDVYKDVDDASIFTRQLFEQFEGREQCGFYWPEGYEDESNSFAKDCIQMIHTVFFHKEKNLKIRDRQNFIEIFYFFLTLKAVDIFHPDYMALSCKDGVDTGAAASGCFYSCLRMLVSDKPWSEEEKDLLLWILYAPALFFRERAIQKDELHRVTSAMQTFQEALVNQKSLLLKECKKLYKEEMWINIEIKKAG
jgi:hypothetical protein